MATSPFSSLSPNDAAVAVRTFPRRFRDAAASATSGIEDDPDEPTVDELAARTGADGRSGLDHVALSVERIEATTHALRSALVSPTQVIDHGLVDPEPAAGSATHSGRLDTELDRLDRASRALAEQVEQADARQWLVTRPTTGAATAHPLDVLQATVGMVLGHLRGLERVLREVRGRPNA
jgi:hypothetical protein